MIRCDDDESVVEKPACFGELEDASDRLVRITDLSIVQRQYVLEVGSIHPPPKVAVAVEVAAVERSPVIGVEHRVERGRRDQIVMDVPHVNEEEERPVSNTVEFVHDVPEDRRVGPVLVRCGVRRSSM